jgi:hypothetical protein
MLYSHYDRRGEPFAWFDGISIWPAAIIRLSAAVLGLYVLLRCCPDKLREVNNELTRDFKLASAKSSGSVSAPRGSKTWPARLVWWVVCLWDRRSRHSITNWKWDELKKKNVGEDAPPFDAKELWKEYREWGHPVNRRLRYIPAAVVYCLALVILMWFLGFPSQPYRGRLSGAANLFALFASIVIFILVTAYVIDATRLCKRLIEILANRRTEWPKPLLKSWTDKLGLDDRYLDEWLDMRLIGRLTEVVGQLIWWPFLLLVLLIVARNPFVANFDWPPSLWLVFGLNTAFVLGYAILLRSAARKAREKELKLLRRKLIKAEKEEKGAALQIEGLMSEIKNMNRGAFAPLSSQPVVHAILVAAGGISIPAIIEYLSAIHW